MLFFYCEKLKKNWETGGKKKTIVQRKWIELDSTTMDYLLTVG